MSYECCHFADAKVRISEGKNKFWGCECRDKSIYAILSRDIIRLKVKLSHLTLTLSSSKGSQVERKGLKHLQLYNVQCAIYFAI